MKFLPRVTALSASVFLAACNFAPKYETPEAPMAATYLKKTDTTRTIADMGWQTFFTDSRLKALIDLGLKNNRDLRIATQNVEVAKAQYGITHSNLFPKVGVTGSQTAQEMPSDMRTPGADAISRSYIAGVGITNFELDFFGKIRNQSEAALQTFYATEQAQRTAHINLVASIANTYFTLRTMEEMEQLVKHNLNAYEQTHRLVNARFKAGMASMLDVNQAATTLESARAALAQTQRNKEQAEVALALLIGQEIPADLPKAAGFGADVVQDNVPAGLPSDLLTRRPDIIGAEHSLKAANANIGAARAAFFPSITLTGLLGVASLDLSKLFTAGRDMWSFNPSVSMPLFSAGALSRSLDVAELRKDIQVASYEKTVQTAFSEVNTALIGLETYRKQLDALRTQTKAAEQSLRLSTLRYTSGIDSFLQVQSAQIAVLGIKQNFLAVGLESLQNKVALYKALGGGWSATDLVKEK